MKGFQGLTIKTFLYGFGIVALILTVVPFIPLDYWWIRMFDFPHIQLTVITFIAALTFLYKFKIDDFKEYLFLGALLIGFIYQLGVIYPYTGVAELNVLESTTSDEAKIITLYTANVLQKNKEYGLVSKQIDSIDPDIVLLTETDMGWRDAIVSSLSADYKYKKEVPLPNTYGMILYSKLELIEPTVHYLVDDSIPSIQSKIRLKTGDLVQLYSIHPTPPMPQENPKSTDRDTEMMITAKMARQSRLPVIVLGDFNDVAWSKTTQLFKNTAELLDVRIGRGLFCSFDANHVFLRWPLDHLFISEDFRVKEIDLCDDIESDHFPFFSRLTYEPEIAEEQMPVPPTEEQLSEADDQIRDFENKKLSKMNVDKR